MSAELTWADTGLKNREISVLNACLYARGCVSNGHFLASGKQSYAAALRLIERGLLSKAETQLAPPMPHSVVVYLTEQNWEAVRGLARANRAEAA